MGILILVSLESDSYFICNVFFATWAASGKALVREVLLIHQVAEEMEPVFARAAKQHNVLPSLVLFLAYLTIR